RKRFRPEALCNERLRLFAALNRSDLHIVIEEMPQQTLQSSHKASGVSSKIENQRFAFFHSIHHLIDLIFGQIELRHLPDETIVARLDIAMSIEVVFIFGLSDDVVDIGVFTFGQIHYPLSLNDLCQSIDFTSLSVGALQNEPESGLRSERVEK